MYTSATDFVTCGFQGVQLNIEIMDDDPKPGFDDFVDALLINHDLPIGQQSPTQTHNGVFGFVMMDLSIMARCIDNFQGPDCSQCMPGFAGAMCDVRINGTECTSLCTGHGQCVDGVPSLICDCDFGFTGAICEHIDDCIGVNCSENGQCVDGESSYTCDCDSGFTGVDCDRESAVMKMVSVWMEWLRTHVTVTLTSLEWSVRQTLMTVLGSTVVEMEYVWMV